LRSKLFIASVFAAACSMGWAQAPKIAVIDMQGALLQTRDGQKAAAELKTKFSPKEQELQKRNTDLQSKQDQYRKSENTLNADQKASLARDIDAIQRNLQRDAQDARQDFEEAQNKLMGGLLQKMQQVLTAYANQNQITMIFDISAQPNNLLYADKATNITAAIIAMYDKNDSVTPTAPPAKPSATPSAPTTPRRSPSSGAAPSGSPK
jgi:outer membrane protein